MCICAVEVDVSVCRLFVVLRCVSTTLQSISCVSVRSNVGRTSETCVLANFNECSSSVPLSVVVVQTMICTCTCTIVVALVSVSHHLNTTVVVVRM